MLNILNIVFIIVPVLVNIAFITLLERKILGYSQLRKGPHKVGIVGIIQPFRDAIKLFSLFMGTSPLIKPEIFFKNQNE